MCQEWGLYRIMTLPNFIFIIIDDCCSFCVFTGLPAYSIIDIIWLLILCHIFLCHYNLVSELLLQLVLLSFFISDMKKRKNCMLAVVRRSQKKYSPAAHPSPGARDGQNLISWRWSLRNKPSLLRIDARNFETDPPTHALCGLRVVRIDSLRFLAECCTRRLNQV